MNEPQKPESSLGSATTEPELFSDYEAVTDDPTIEPAIPQPDDPDAIDRPASLEPNEPIDPPMAIAGAEPADPAPTVAPEAPTVASTAPPAGVETEVVCPGCGLTLVGESPRPTAAWFCPRCDYPLFWAESPSSSPETPPSTAARRRLPGTGGRVVLGAEPCWHCGEMSSPGDGECGRCAATLPKPLAPKVMVDVPYPVDVLVPYAVKPVIWPFIASAACAAAAVASVVTAWWVG